MASHRPDPATPGTTPAATDAAQVKAAHIEAAQVRASEVKKAFAASGVTIRPAGEADSVAGVRPRWVTLPETTEEIAAILRVTADHDLTVVVTGGGTKLDWGRPPERCDVLIDTCCLNKILEHAAGDLVVRVEAGVTMEALAAALAERGQELALDVPVDGATVGGTLATATAGPRRFRYGTARDLLIGITAVLADGTIAKSGGKVVKNVAGYDLGKLFTGSYGTLGVIAEATFRLHPLPAERRWVSASFDHPVTETDDEWTDEDGQTFATTSTELATDLHGVVRSIAESQLEPSAIELDWPEVGGPCTVAVLVEGTSAAERASAVQEMLGEKARIEAHRPRWWGRLPEPPPPVDAFTGDPASHGSSRFTGSSSAAGEPEHPHTGCRRSDHPGTADQDMGSGASGHLLAEYRNVFYRLPGSFVAPFMAARAAEVRAAVRGSLASGVFHVALPPGTAPGKVAAFVSELRGDIEDISITSPGRVIVLAAPEEIGRRVDRWGHIGALTLMRRVKARFDPDRRLSPGRFVGGI